LNFPNDINRIFLFRPSFALRSLNKTSKYISMPSLLFIFSHFYDNSNGLVLEFSFLNIVVLNFRIFNFVTHYSRTIDAELTADLCDVVAPSDIVTVTGVVKAMPVSDQPGNLTTVNF
jgi:hypothetical protein